MHFLDVLTSSFCVLFAEPETWMFFISSFDIFDFLIFKNTNPILPTPWLLYFDHSFQLARTSESVAETIRPSTTPVHR